MTESWYYGRETEIFGPYSEGQLAALAAGGDVRSSDTVWREGADGVGDGVPAGRIGALFPAPAPARRGRAVAGRGVTIVGQDGTTVKYRMRCTTCGHDDSSWKSMAIARGTTRVGFYCPKCRHRRDGEVHGHIG